MEQQTKEKLSYVMFVLFFIVSGFLLGWIGNNLYKDMINRRTLNGLWIPEKNESEALNIAYKMDKISNWVCINTKGMDYNDCENTASHECGHEVWSKLCEKNNNELCLRGQELLNNYSKENG